MEAVGAGASVSLIVGEAERLLRRFNDEDPSHADAITVDEGSAGVRKLRGGALRFDDDGCSVFRHEVLIGLALSASAITHPPFTAIAVTSRSEVEGFRSGLAVDPVDAPEFSVKADPLEPGAPYDPAHTLIYAERTYPSKTKRRAAISDLAGTAFTLA